MQKSPPTITTAELHRLVARAVPLWLIFVPDDWGSDSGRIPGSLTTTDEDLLAALAADTPMVVYGESDSAVPARSLATRLASEGSHIRWYPDGLRGWAAAGHPIEPA